MARFGRPMPDEQHADRDLYDTGLQQHTRGCARDTVLIPLVAFAGRVNRTGPYALRALAAAAEPQFDNALLGVVEQLDRRLGVRITADVEIM